MSWMRKVATAFALLLSTTAAEQNTATKGKIYDNFISQDKREISTHLSHHDDSTIAAQDPQNWETTIVEIQEKNTEIQGDQISSPDMSMINNETRKGRKSLSDSDTQTSVGQSSSPLQEKNSDYIWQTTSPWLPSPEVISSPKKINTTRPIQQYLQHVVDSILVHSQRVNFDLNYVK